MPNTNSFMQIAKTVVDKMPVVQGVVTEIINYKTTQVLFGPIINDVPKAYAAFAQQHLKARNLIFILVTVAGFIAGLVLALTNQDFRNFLDTWIPIPELTSINPTLSYIYRGPTFASYVTSFVSDVVFKAYFWLICGDREYNLERVYCEEVLLPKAQKMPIAEVAQALGITPADLLAEFKNIRQQYRKGHTDTGAQSKDLENLLKVFMTRDPKKIAEAYEQHKATFNPIIEKAQQTEPNCILTQYRRGLQMVCPPTATTYGALDLGAANDTTRSLLDCCPV